LVRRGGGAALRSRNRRTDKDTGKGRLGGQAGGGGPRLEKQGEKGEEKLRQS